MAFSLSCFEIISNEPEEILISKKYSTTTSTLLKLYGLQSDTTKGQIFVELSRKLEEFKKIMSSNISEDRQLESLVGLDLVDAVLRLGIEYNFQEEIEAILEKEYMIFYNNNNNNHNYNNKDHYEDSRRFRLLRQRGYYVTADVFNKFKDSNGKFNQTLTKDIKGLMELFEASQLCLKHEHILEEAEDFSRNHLNKLLKCHVDDRVRATIVKTLQQPYHKSLVRFTATNFLEISINGQTEKHWITVLRELAREDFKIVQSIHQKEITKISNWWKELGLTKEMNFVRDQPLKWYLWTVTTISDPSLSDQRIELTKPISLVYIIDDIFDVYGVLDELILFTEAVNKWEITAMERLPNFMKTCFKALDDITEEISNKIYHNYGWNPTSSLRKSWAKLCNAFLVEAKWFGSKSLPDEEEYLKNAIVSSGVHVVLVHMLFLLGQGITQEAVDQLDEIPGLITSTATILRLWDDLGNAKDENQNGHDGSYIECYMTRHRGCEVREVKGKVMKMIGNEWKQLNKECLESKHFPHCFKKACLDAARMVPIMYDYNEIASFHSSKTMSSYCSLSNTQFNF